ncbi:MAG: formylglycine-generating enzyme family protein [Phycisphaeraceae bacterium]
MKHLRLLRVLCIAWLITLTLPAAFAADKPLTPPQEQALAKEIATIFQTKCALCHDGNTARKPNASKEQARAVRKIDYILDLSRVAKSLVKGADPNDSDLWYEVNEDNMPPKDSTVGPLSKTQKALIEKWIKAGAPVPAKASRKSVSTEDIYKLIGDDLKKMQPAARLNARYLSLAHLHNAGDSEEDLQLYREALAKLVNSLSWSRAIHKPEAIDEGKLILRIDVAALGWGESVWTTIHKADPYAMKYRFEWATSVYAMTNCDVPLVRGDWFAFAASRPPLYHEVLAIPKTIDELEESLGIKAAENIRLSKAARAGVIQSGVSQHNRVVERHESPFGAYWKSYDFGSSIARADIRALPLGPGGDALSFKADGGEMIFNLPNGMQAYMLVDDQGNRIDEGPIKIVQDATRDDKIVINGISCMSCHNEGMKSADDVIREHVTQVGISARYPKDAYHHILKLYAEPAAFRKLLQQDETRFKKALAEAGVREPKEGQVEPVLALVRRFEKPVTSPLLAAAELGLAEGELLIRAGELAALKPMLVRSEARGGIPRDQFIHDYARGVAALKLGEHVGVDAIFPRELTNVIGMKLVRIDAGTFTRGSPKSEQGRRDDEPQVKVKITRPFMMGVHEVTAGQFDQFVRETGHQTIAEKEGFALQTDGRGGSTRNPGMTWQTIRKAMKNDNTPVSVVSWDDAHAFCDWLSRKDKRAYRLPTEAEWEYACRAGTTTRFHWGDPKAGATSYANTADAKLRKSIANWTADESLDDGQATLAPVGSFKPNAWGLFDMHGNLEEWCLDFYSPPAYTKASDTDPVGPYESPFRVIRGGSWAHLAESGRSAHRSFMKPSFRDQFTGFRVVAELTQ